MKRRQPHRALSLQEWIKQYSSDLCDLQVLQMPKTRSRLKEQQSRLAHLGVTIESAVPGTLRPSLGSIGSSCDRDTGSQVASNCCAFSARVHIDDSPFLSFSPTLQNSLAHHGDLLVTV